MQKKSVLLFLIIVIVLAAGFIAFRARPRATNLRLDLVGTPGLKVAGHYVADSVTNQFAAQLPANIAVHARAFEYSIWMEAPEGELRGELRSDTGMWGSSAAQDEFRGVRGGYQHRWGSKSAWFTTLSKEEQATR